ncbi:polysaccharide chain length determinant protein (PEP-CTERM system associated) [Rhodothalassium salexigens DSM 2132]|uniref:Polysaccharide chain length determinant protein (PEP-CTERM system associated) n=1 Tax=Rhodothalassium salexigens DSM 2132 TaxID=1188247 RepID=A0A4R2PCK8_RHOSA|nr:XrtA system polysaccharide chain length determinant [Rhodothalassium salexigens]MBB4212036.1 polysaccharide chain length determinant protein (PEP-CTERM system associated) [Rhodothalassium salexigens DSM 2132]TCP32913.1 polysaccharide chain length determinant protein (PEP-CTERM system associated) [Rhodothalassium salexigens DSM 2132]
MDLDALYTQLTFYVRALWRRRWLALGMTYCIAAVGAAMVASLPDVYRSSARIFVDTGNVLQPLLRGLAVDENVDNQVEIMRRTLLSRPNLEEIARRTDLDVTVVTQRDRQELLEGLERRIKVQSDRQNLFDISYQGEDPVLARDVVQALTTLFVENNLGENRAEMEMAQEFLQRQVEQYSQKLDAAESELAEFRRQNYELLPGQSGLQERLETARQRLTDLRSARGDAQAKIEVLEEELEQTPRLIGGVMSQSGGPPTNLEVQIAEVQGQLDDLKARYTDQHPDVVVLQRRLDRLLDQQEQAYQGFGGGGPTMEGGEGSVPNPVYADLRLEIVREKSTIRTLEAEIERAGRTVAEAQRKLDAVPAVEARLNRLTRDYEVIRAQYEKLLERQESARISSDREQAGNRVNFRIIEAPEVAPVPSGPDRQLLMLAVLALSIGLGGVAAIAAALLNLTYADTEQLSNDLDLPVIGSIQLTARPREDGSRLGSALRGTVAILVLLGFAGGITVVEAVFTLERYRIVAYGASAGFLLLGGLSLLVTQTALWARLRGNPGDDDLPDAMVAA